MNVTALLAHPDDELMCAGTLARLDNVTLVTLFVDEREQEWRSCADVIGCEVRKPPLVEDDFAWTRLAVSYLEPRMPQTDLWITHRADDANTSHGHIARIAQTLARKNRSSVWEIDQSLPGGLVQGSPNLFVSIDPAVKARAVGCYPSQLARYPGMGEAIADRDRLYGWEIGCEAAEGFTVRKAIWL